MSTYEADLEEYEQTQAGSGWPAYKETPSTVWLTQFKRPYGKREQVAVELTPELSTLSKGMYLSCEVLMTGQVVIYGRLLTDDEENELMEFATNSAGPDSPDKVVTRIIEKLAKR